MSATAGNMTMIKDVQRKEMHGRGKGGEARGRARRVVILMSVKNTRRVERIRNYFYCISNQQRNNAKTLWKLSRGVSVPARTR